MIARRWVGMGLGFATAAAIAGLWLIGSLLIAPSRREVGPPPPDLSAADVTFASPSGATIAGWYGPPSDDRPVVILSHGVRGARDQLGNQALFLRKAGYGVLLYDAQAHGESTGDAISFGHLESRDAQAAVEFVRANAPRSSIGFIGPSLAGASALLGPEPIAVDALVLEAVYPTLVGAVENRIAIRLGRPLARLLSPLLLWQVEPRLDFDPYALNPIDRISRVCAPILLIAGSMDRHTRLDESRALFDAAREPKELWIVEGAIHESFYDVDRQVYEARLLDFFGRNLATPRRPSISCS
ncbi:lysophospholipase [Myxococcota bacterium]|nr:lysophospholipase [Myxococcota bacterium]